MEDSRSAQKNPSGEWWNIYTYQQLLQIIEDITIQENEILTFCSKEPIQMDWKANKKLGYEWEEKGVLTKFLPLVIVLPLHSTFCNITTSCQVKRSFHYFWEEETHVKFISFCLIRKEGPAIPNLPITVSPKKEWVSRMSTTQQEASQIQHLPPDPFHPHNIRRTIKKEDKHIHQHHNKNQVNRANQIHTPCSIPPARQVEYPRSHFR